MEKRILMAACATLAFAGQVHANAAILNAASRFILTGAGISGAGLYAAEKYPNAFDRVSFLVSGSATQTPNIQPQTNQLTEAKITEILKQNNSRETFGSLSLPSLQQAGMGASALLTAFIIYDSFYGHQYTQMMIKASADFIHKKVKALWDKIKGIDTKINKVDDNLQELTYDQRKANLKAEYESKKAEAERKALFNQLHCVSGLQTTAAQLTILQAEHHWTTLPQDKKLIRQNIATILKQVKDNKIDLGVNVIDKLQEIRKELNKTLTQLEQEYKKELSKLEEENKAAGLKRQEERKKEQSKQETDDTLINQSFESPNSGLYNTAASFCSTTSNLVSKLKFW